jgi:hypothetical protein
MAEGNRHDLSRFSQVLTPIFETYPTGNLCDVCAQKVAGELQKAQYKLAIVTIQNERMPGQPNIRPPFIHGLARNNQPFLLGQSGFHQAVRIEIDSVLYYIDALVYLHYGLSAVDEVTYWRLFWYPDGIEITKVQEV